jgi:hypothetical protein
LLATTTVVEPAWVVPAGVLVAGVLVGVVAGVLVAGALVVGALAVPVAVDPGATVPGWAPPTALVLAGVGVVVVVLVAAVLAGVLVVVVGFVVEAVLFICTDAGILAPRMSCVVVPAIAAGADNAAATVASAQASPTREQTCARRGLGVLAAIIARSC